MSAKIDLKGKVVLITGAAQGIGLEVLREAVRREAIPVGIDVNAELIAKVQQEFGNQSVCHVADVSDADAMERIVEDTIERFGGIDVVIANAGIERVGAIVNMEKDVFETVINVNLLGVYRTLKPALRSCIQRKGHVLAISSIAATIPLPYGAAYSASKAAVDIMMRCLRMEISGTGATAGAAYFGFVQTDMAGRIFSDPALAKALKQVPERLIGLGPNPTPQAVSKKILDGVERRKARVVAPRMVAVTYALRGLYAFFDDRAARRLGLKARESI